MRLTTTNGWRLTLTRMRHVPTLGKNLISLDTLNDFGYNGVFSNWELSIYRGSELVFKDIKRNTLYVFEGITLSISAIAHRCLTRRWLGFDTQGFVIWGRRGWSYCLRGIFYPGLRLPTLNFVSILCLEKTLVKVHRGAHITNVVLDYIHSDRWGPSRVEGMRGFCYFVSFVDKSQFTWLRLFKSKDEAFKTFKQ